MAADASRSEVLPPSLISTSEPPSLFDGTTRLYIAYVCPYARRAWIARNYKGLQGKIELVPIDLESRPAWYKEKVYPTNKVPSLEHNNEVKGDSMDLVKLIDAEFEGPKLLPDDQVKLAFGEELLTYSDVFNSVMFKGMRTPGNVSDEVDAAFDKIEEALSKFSDGPFFLGQFSQDCVRDSWLISRGIHYVAGPPHNVLHVDINYHYVDIAYAPFIEMFEAFFSEIKNYDITKGRPKLTLWIEELNKTGAFTQTQLVDRVDLVAATKKRFGIP